MVGHHVTVNLSSWVLIFFILRFAEPSNGAGRPAVINIGAIFSLGSINGNVSKIAMEAAVSDVNADPSVLGGSKLAIHIHDSNYSGFLGIIGGTFLCTTYLSFDLIVSV